MPFLKHTMSWQISFFLISKFSFSLNPLPFFPLPPHFPMKKLSKNKSPITPAHVPLPLSVSSLHLSKERIRKGRGHSHFSRLLEGSWKGKEKKRIVFFVPIPLLSRWFFMGKKTLKGKRKIPLFLQGLWYYVYSVVAKTKFWFLGKSVVVTTCPLLELNRLTTFLRTFINTNIFLSFIFVFSTFYTFRMRFY